MSRRQRRLHLLAWLVLGPLAIASVLVALAERPPAALDEGAVIEGAP